MKYFAPLCIYCRNRKTIILNEIDKNLHLLYLRIRLFDIITKSCIRYVYILMFT